MHLIELKGITKKYDLNIGCFDINFSINQGEIYGFIGPNGAGKTTVIRQMMGFIRSDSGQGKIFGLDIWKESDKIMKNLGYVAGEVAIPEYMTGISYLKVLAEIRKNVNWDYVKKLIDYFELDATRKIKKMSKGMKQKVALIAAFMHKPKVLIMDEPTSGLDPLMQEKFNKLVKTFEKEGTTIFMSSHIFSEIDNICNRVAIIKKGKIISEIDIDNMKKSFNKIYQINFANIIDYQEFLKKEWNVLKKDEEINQIEVKIKNENVNEFLKEISQFNVNSFKLVPFSLEKHFLKYYQDEIDSDEIISDFENRN